MLGGAGFWDPSTVVQHLKGEIAPRKGVFHLTHRIHGTGIFTYIYHQKSTIHVGKYTSPMDPMGYIKHFNVGLLMNPSVGQFQYVVGTFKWSILAHLCFWNSQSTYTWNPKQPFINGCFSWMIPNLYLENGCFTKHPFVNGCLGLQAVIYSVYKLYIIIYFSICYMNRIHIIMYFMCILKTPAWFVGL